MPPKKPVPTKAPTKPGGKTGTAPKAATNKAAVGGKKTGAPTKPSAARVSAVWRRCVAVGELARGRGEGVWGHEIVHEEQDIYIASHQPHVSYKFLYLSLKFPSQY